MGIADRPATCASCGGRLSRKQWYYRNGKYFCKRHCWDTERAKLKKEQADATTKKQEVKAQEAVKGSPTETGQDAKEKEREEQKPGEAAGTGAKATGSQTAEATPAESEQAKDTK